MYAATPEFIVLPCRSKC